MSKTRFFLSTLIFSLLLACSSEEKVEEAVQVTPDYVLIKQYGHDYENGYLHGSTVPTAIQQQLSAWQDHMQKALGLNRDSIHAIIHTHTGLVAQIKQQAPELLEEIKGIADGAIVDRQLLLAYNLGEEIYNYQNRVMESCSNLGLQKQEVNILTYNQDLPDFLQGENKPVILQSKHAFIFAMPGTIGISGVSKTLAVSCNSLPMLRMNPDGLGLSFIIRKLLQFETNEKVDTYLDQVVFAVPQNILLASTQGVRGIEASGYQTSIYGNQEDSSLYHTNFPIHNLDYKYPGFQAAPCRRFAAIDSLLEQTPVSEIDDQIATAAFGRFPLLNDETYLRFTAIFRKDKMADPQIIFINPKQSQGPVSLSF